MNILWKPKINLFYYHHHRHQKHVLAALKLINIMSENTKELTGNYQF